MADEKTPLWNAYARRVADDLEAIRKEQADVAEQITGLQNLLHHLASDEAWLVQVQDGLAATTTPRQGPSGAAVVGAPSRAEESRGDLTSASSDTARSVAKPRRARSARAAKASSTGKATTSRPVTSKKGPAQPRTAPPLHQLILGILLNALGQPRTAREIADQLTADHPTRATSAQSVRNNLEKLVDTQAVEKSRQGSSVMYTAHAADDVAPRTDAVVEQAAEKTLVTV